MIINNKEYNTQQDIEQDYILIPIILGDKMVRNTICSCGNNRKKKYSTSGCYLCWTCENCGKFGGCDNEYFRQISPKI